MSTVTAGQPTAVGTSGAARRVRVSPGVRPLIPLMIGIIAVCIYATTASTRFLSTTNFENITQEVGVLGILAVGTTLLLISGQLDLSVGSAVSLGTVLIAKSLENGHTDTFAVVLVLVVCVVIGLLWGVMVAFVGVPPFILTLGGLSAVAAIAQIISKQTPIPSGLSFASLSVGHFLGVPLPFLFMIILSVLGALLLRYSTFGRNLYAIGSNERAAYLSGVPVAGTKIAVYALTGLLTGLASLMMIARLGSGDATSGSGLELQAITAVVLGGATLFGGKGSMLGTFLGVFMLGIASNALTIAGLPNSYSLFVYGAVLILAVTWATIDEKRGSVWTMLFRRRGTAR